MTADLKIQAARTALVLDEPFFGVLSLRLRIIADPTCKTGWTDGMHLGYNPAWVDTLTHAQVVAFLIHEVMHCANGHPWRRDGREHERWNEACDYAINPIIRDAGFTLPDNVLLDDAHAGKSAEWVFDRLPPKPQGSPQDEQDSQDGGEGEGDESQDAQGSQDAQDGQDESQGDGDEGDESQDSQGDAQGDGDGDAQDSQDGTSDDAGSPGDDSGDGDAQDGQDGTSDGAGTPDLGGDLGEIRDAPTGTDAIEAEATEADWQRAVQEAASAAHARGELPGSLERFARESAEPVVDWRSVLRRFMQDVARSDYSWVRPNTRYLAGGLYLPALHAEGMGPIVFVVDTSGSIDDVLLAKFSAEMQSAIDEAQPTRVHVMYCDSRVHRIDTFEQGEPLEMNAVGGGWTDFRPAFAALADLDDEPAAMIYLTDLYGAFPDVEPEVPVLWAATTRNVAPWGETVRIDN